MTLVMNIISFYIIITVGNEGDYYHNKDVFKRMYVSNPIEIGFVCNVTTNQSKCIPSNIQLTKNEKVIFYTSNQICYDGKNNEYITCVQNNVLKRIYFGNQKYTKVLVDIQNLYLIMDGFFYTIKDFLCIQNTIINKLKKIINLRTKLVGYFFKDENVDENVDDIINGITKNSIDKELGILFIAHKRFIIICDYLTTTFDCDFSMIQYNLSNIFIESRYKRMYFKRTSNIITSCMYDTYRVFFPTSCVDTFLNTINFTNFTIFTHLHHDTPPNFYTVYDKTLSFDNKVLKVFDNKITDITVKSFTSCYYSTVAESQESEPPLIEIKDVREDEIEKTSEPAVEYNKTILEIVIGTVTSFILTILLGVLGKILYKRKTNTDIIVNV